MSSVSELTELEELYSLLSTAHDSNLLKKHLTRRILDDLKDRTTQKGGTLADCIRSGCIHPDSQTGVHASDPDAYVTFAPLLDLIIKSSHGLPVDEDIKHPPLDFGDLDEVKLDDLDPEGKYVISTRVRVARSVDGFGFHPVMTLKDRFDLEEKVAGALRNLPGELKGEYCPLSELSPSLQEELIRGHYLFHDKNKFRRTAGAYEDWPAGRGIFFNREKSFLVWVGEEDQIRIIAMQPGADLRSVYVRLVKGAQALENSLPFIRDSRLGYLAFCPSNLGTGMRASVLVHLPRLSRRPDFQDVLTGLHLQSRGTYGESTESVGDVYDISNKRRLGLTEIETLMEMYEGVKEILRLEKELSEQM